MRALIDGKPVAMLGITDRGLAYGDGVFESMRVVEAAIPLQQRHLARLALGCERLGIRAPAAALIAREIRELVAGAGARAGVVKLIVTRGSGDRGYAPSSGRPATRILSLHQAPAIDPSVQREGIAARWCALRLGINPRLAGIKHLNRLEQVLARAEWDDPAIAEGLMCDAEGRVVGAVAANLFAVVAGRLVTPALHRCGVEGVARGLVLDAPPEHVAIEVRDMLPAELEGASEVFLTNSIRGVIPLTRLGERAWPVGPVTRALLRRFAALGLSPYPHGQA